MTENKAELAPYMKKAEDIYGLMKSFADMLSRPLGCDVSIFGDNTYKDVVIEHTAIALETQYLQGFNEGTRKAMENETNHLIILQEKMA